MSARGFVKRTATVALLASLGLVVSAPASADSTPTPTPQTRTGLLSRTPDPATISRIQQKCGAAIGKRLATLSTDVSRINDAKDLAASDRAQLLSIASADTSGLTSLRSKIQSDTTETQLLTDCRSIVSEYRIYVLFEPQMHLVIAADRIAATVTKLQALMTKVQTDVNDSGAGDGVKQQATAKLDDISGKLQAAATAASGVPAAVLNLTPAGYPGDASALKTARSSLETARQDLEGLRGDLRDLINLLKTGRAGDSSSAQPSPTAA